MTDELLPIRARRGWPDQAAAHHAALPENQPPDLSGLTMTPARRSYTGRPPFTNRYGLPPLPPPMVAAGGWTAPITPGSAFDFWTRHEPWDSPDRRWADRVDVDAWLFPAAARIEARARDYRRRLTAARGFLRMAWRALGRPQVDPYDD